MKKVSFLLLLAVFLCGETFSQVEEAPDTLLPQTLVIVDTTAYSVEDFLWYYDKTLREHKLQMKPSDYISYYVDLKKKVAEAEQMQLDTTRAFREEFFQHLRRTAHNRMYLHQVLVLHQILFLLYIHLSN